MSFEQEHDLEHSRWSARTSRSIDLICLLALIATVVTVIYGFVLRAIWAHGYYVAVAIAIIGALTLMIGLAQQVIAARDAATWRSMAVWQLRAARRKILSAAPPGASGPSFAPDSELPDYYEHLMQVLVESVQRSDEDTVSK